MNTLLNKTDFYEELKAAVEERISRDYKEPAAVTIREAASFNNPVSAKMEIRFEKQPCAPNFKLDQLYEIYVAHEGSKTVDDIADCVLSAMANNKSDFELPDFNNVEAIKNSLFCKVINRELNSEYLQNAVYVTKYDLAIVCYIKCNTSTDGLYSILLTKSMAEAFGFTDTEQIISLALENTAKLFPNRVFPIKYAFRGNYEENTDIDSFIPQYPFPTVMSNSTALNGFTCVFYPGMLKRLSEENFDGRNLYILPSSIHEAVILLDDGLITSDECLEMTRTANAELLDRKEFLSDNVYYYNAETEELSFYQ